ncbi:MAG: hypothetical protein AB1847_08995 [bacterium]
MKTEHFRRQVNLACQGLITWNNNALELAHYFIPQGNLLLSHLRRYAYSFGESQQGQECRAGAYLLYLLPFLKAFGATDQRIEEYSTVSISLMPGARNFLDRASQTAIPYFLISSGYRPFVQSLGYLLGFQESEIYYTPLDLDHFSIDESEKETLKDLADEIVKMPLPAQEEAHPPTEILSEHIPYYQRLKIIFEEEIASMQIGDIMTRAPALWGDEKVKAVIDSLEKTGNSAQNILYLGCSVLDAAALTWVREAGGMAVSFNGDQTAIRSAEVAVRSGSCAILAVLCDTFSRQGKEGIVELVKTWDIHKIQTEKLKIDPSLINELFSHEPESFPQLELVTSSNLERLIGDPTAAAAGWTLGERH